jgi:hypothetical protein
LLLGGDRLVVAGGIVLITLALLVTTEPFPRLTSRSATYRDDDPVHDERRRL